MLGGLGSLDDGVGPFACLYNHGMPTCGYVTKQLVSNVAEAHEAGHVLLNVSSNHHTYQHLSIISGMIEGQPGGGGWR